MSKKDSVFRMMGASNHSLLEREPNDFYATEPKAVEMLLELETFSNVIWEPACGQGHICKVLDEHGYTVVPSDIVDRGYQGTEIFNFLNPPSIYPLSIPNWGDFDIITNPPYKHATAFVRKALGVVQDGHKVAMFLKLTFLESKERRRLFETYPPKTVYVSSSRLNCAKDGDFEKYKKNTAIAYCWFIWEKGYQGVTSLKWFN